MATEPDLAKFNPFDPETMQCPFPEYAKMRADAPVLHVESLNMFLVTRHDLVGEVARDATTFAQFRGSSMPLPSDDLARLAAAQREGYPRVPTMFNADPPAHTRYRRLVSKAFTVKAINDLEPAVRAITTTLIDAWIDMGHIEFVGQFAAPLPMEVIAKALGVPDDRLADFKRWSDDTVVGFGANPPLDVMIEAAHGVNDFQRYFAAELEQRRDHPQDDLLTRLVEARIDDDDPDVVDKRPLDIPEMLSLILQMLVGGNETTTKLLAEMMRLLGEHPEHWDAVRQDPAAIPGIVEETLRLSSPGQAMFRTATRDVDLGGVRIPEGGRVVIVFASANRDEQLFVEPDEFDPKRANIGDHVAFGKGTHYCLGANLTRLEVRVALEELARRIASFSLSDSNDYAYNPSFMLRGLIKLDLDIAAS
jgi:cytochrome P450